MQRTYQRKPVHESREQQAREDQVVHNVHDDVILLEDVGPLPDIKPRPGYVQRWVSVGGSTGLNRRNIVRKAQGGWTPRDPSTVSKAMQMMTVQHESLGGVIGTHDMVLMERPEEIQRKARAINHQKIRSLTTSANQNLFREHERLRTEGPGFMPLPMESTAKVEVGRIPVAPDED